MNNEPLARRNFIEKAGKAGVAVGLSATVLPSILSTNSANAMAKNTPPVSYAQQPLPYGYTPLNLLLMQ